MDLGNCESYHTDPLVSKRPGKTQIKKYKKLKRKDVIKQAEGPKASPKGRNLEVRARRASRLLVWILLYKKMNVLINICDKYIWIFDNSNIFICTVLWKWSWVTVVMWGLTNLRKFLCNENDRCSQIWYWQAKVRHLSWIDNSLLLQFPQVSLFTRVW